MVKCTDILYAPQLQHVMFSIFFSLENCSTEKANFNNETSNNR